MMVISNHYRVFFLSCNQKETNLVAGYIWAVYVWCQFLMRKQKRGLEEKNKKEETRDGRRKGNWCLIFFIFF